MLRTKLIAGNWKMYTLSATARELAAAIRTGLAPSAAAEVAVCPPFPWLPVVANALKDSPIALGAQDVFPENDSAFTGEVSPAMLLDAGCKFVIVGHSERRHVLGERDDLINRKARFALANCLHVILCVGETLAEREANKTEAVLDNQLTWGVRE